MEIMKWGCAGSVNAQSSRQSLRQENSQTRPLECLYLIMVAGGKSNVITGVICIKMAFLKFSFKVALQSLIKGKGSFWKF